MEQLFVKIFNRPMYMISCQNYDKGERIMLSEFLKGAYFWDPLFINELGQGTDVYYNFSDPLQDPSIIVKLFNNKEFLLASKKDFYQLCDKVRKINEDRDFSDLETIFNLSAKLFPMVGISNVLGDNRDNIKGVSDELKPIFMEIRKYSDGLIHNSHLQMLKILEKIIPEKYIGYEKYIKYEEFISRKFPQIEELKKRKEGYLFHRGEFYVGDKKESYILKNKIILKGFSSDNKAESREIRGSIAFKGKIKGFIKVVLDLDDMEKVKEGDIMVTSMTTPDFLLAMKKATAFVTDEGGITCHAAIVARELRKPCIIGTKIATQVLKDGDLVEVDALPRTETGSGAERGIVKILERARTNDKVENIITRRNEAKSRTEQSSGAGADEGAVRILRQEE